MAVGEGAGGAGGGGGVAGGRVGAGPAAGVCGAHPPITSEASPALINARRENLAGIIAEIISPNRQFDINAGRIGVKARRYACAGSSANTLSSTATKKSAFSFEKTSGGLILMTLCSGPSVLNRRPWSFMRSMM